MTPLNPFPAGTVLWNVDLLGGLEVLRAHHRTHCFPRHFHDTFVVQIVEEGVNEFECNGRTYRSRTGDVILFNPGDVHTGRSVGRGPLSYRCLYPRPELLVAAARSTGLPSAAPVRFPRPLIHDNALAAELLRLHEALGRPRQKMTAESLLVRTLARMVEQGRRVEGGPWVTPAPLSRVKLVQDFLRANLCTNPTLEQLEDVAGLSRFHLLRVFRKEVGLPPHEYLMSLRVERARTLLARRWPIARAALEAGFADQSHLTRCFKSLVGTTPGRFQRGSNFIQDSPPGLS